MKISEMFGDSKFIKKEDVMRPILVTISHVAIEPVGRGQDEKMKAVMYFQEDVKPWVFPKCSGMEIELAYGADSEQWGGQQIELYCDSSVMMEGKRVGGTRCRIPGPAAQPAAPRQRNPQAAQRPAAGARQAPAGAPRQNAQRPAAGAARGAAPRQAAQQSAADEPEPGSFDGEPGQDLGDNSPF